MPNTSICRWPGRRARRCGATLRGEYQRIGDPAALIQRLTDDLRAVSHDGHLWLEYDPQGARDEPIHPSAANLDKLRRRLPRTISRSDKAERLGGNVGYVKFGIFPIPSWPPPLPPRRWTSSPTPMR